MALVWDCYVIRDGGSGMGLLCYHGVVALVWDCYVIREKWLWYGTAMLSWSSGSGMGLLCYHGVVALVWDCYVIGE